VLLGYFGHQLFVFRKIRFHSKYIKCELTCLIFCSEMSIVSRKENNLYTHINHKELYYDAIATRRFGKLRGEKL